MCVCVCVCVVRVVRGVHACVRACVCVYNDRVCVCVLIFSFNIVYISETRFSGVNLQPFTK